MEEEAEDGNVQAVVEAAPDDAGATSVKPSLNWMKLPTFELIWSHYWV